MKISGITQPYLFSDLALSRRLERAEAQGNARFVEARAKLFPQSGAPVFHEVSPLAAPALVALLGGACTIPAARKQGAQLALLESRLRYGAEQGCDLAMMCALPGSASQRNAERHGFRIAYTRIKWQRQQYWKLLPCGGEMKSPAFPNSSDGW